MEVTKKEVLDALGVDAAQFDAFIQRGMLLTQRDALTSKIANVRAEQARVNEQFNLDVHAIEVELSQLQAQINALS